MWGKHHLIVLPVNGNDKLNSQFMVKRIPLKGGLRFEYDKDKIEDFRVK